MAHDFTYALFVSADEVGVRIGERVTTLFVSTVLDVPMWMEERIDSKLSYSHKCADLRGLNVGAYVFTLIPLQTYILHL